MKLLLDNGADIDGTLNSECLGTAFWVYDYLLSFRPNPPPRILPIQLAVDEEHIRLLVEHGSDLTSDVFSRLALEHADLLQTIDQIPIDELMESLKLALRNKGSPKHIITRILNHPEKDELDQILYLLLQSGHDKDVIRILEAGANPNADIKGPIFHSLSYDQMKLVVEHTKHPIDMCLWTKTCRLSYRQLYELTTWKTKFLWELIKFHRLRMEKRAHVVKENEISFVTSMPKYIFKRVLIYV